MSFVQQSGCEFVSPILVRSRVAVSHASIVCVQAEKCESAWSVLRTVRSKLADGLSVFTVSEAVPGFAVDVFANEADGTIA